MATPDFVLALREKIGSAPLWLTGVTAVVTRADGDDEHAEILMVKRSDNGAWTPVTGIIDPGEQPAVAAAREVLEEANVTAVASRLAWVNALPPMTYPNGDQAQYLDLTFLMTYVSGEPHPADGENSEARWFRADALPTISANFADRIAHALSSAERTAFHS
ncbi:NUDIX hydrolase [Subtercola frigoramans]|uniref:8-oxo-dGTP pyrophosphatase MutT (NUDIX family) n=1 Tax=Subtercola frigoramans TaxID=120298 RepID=A0ABS2L5X1_9MICO|nr:NUDIX domain-containing protein [Subtercola frigoramans]MBM7472443.1 8-oxo-dGTP pyrophosphatase MutT (NUDIX family) [Subtercola frigoramans]